MVFEAGSDDFLEVSQPPADPTRAWAVSNRGRDRVALVRVDLTTGNEAVVHQDPRVDLAGVWVHRTTEALLSAWSVPDLPNVRWFDDALQRDLEGIPAPDPGRP